MADESKEKQHQHQLSLQMDPQAATGVYSNLMMISHRKEEFVLDFMFVQPQRSQQGQSIANLRARVITSPEHMKRIVQAMQDNIARYEKAFGPIEEATDLPNVIH